MAYKGLLATLRNDCNAMASAIISKDGAVVDSDVPEEISRETFAIMSATIMGAGVTAALELKKTAPDRIVLDSTDVRTVIMNAGKRRILVVVVPPDTDPSLVVDCSRMLLESLKDS
jgi:predicted regulator of Ras-like GTPase activity (Roadblock/LC7/MglB family)